MSQFEDLTNFATTDYLVNVIIYAALSAPVFLWFWVIFKDRFHSRRIQRVQSATKTALRREVRNSIVSLFIFTVIDVIIYIAQQHGYTQIYTEVSQYGWAYLVFSLVVIILVHDAWFYFIHRLMHHPKIYKYVHRVHHLSTDPSPFAALSFHPFEAILEGGVYIVFAFMLPVHLVALWSWQVIQITLNVVGHLGYEIFPKGFTRHWLFKFKATSTHHNMHHEQFSGNYGFYFTWWDKIFGTEFKHYHQTFDEIHERIEKTESSEPFFTPSTSSSAPSPIVGNSGN